MFVRVSVAMAVYNGEEYLREQIDSIINQLRSDDELVISYNDSTDDTWGIIKAYAINEEKIKLFKCNNVGVIANFNNAIENSKGKYIFLADQDDVWYPHKIETVVRYFENSDALAIVHNTEIVNKDLIPINESLFEVRKAKVGLIKNILKNSYQGCCLAFKSELVPYICPIPKNVPMHDQWIGLNSEIYGNVFFINEKLIAYRRHDKNVSPNKLKLLQKLINRFNLLLELVKRLYTSRPKNI